MRLWRRAAGGLFSAGSLYPMEVAKTRIANAKKSSNPNIKPPTLLGTMKDMYQKGGLSALYSEWYFSAGQSASEKFIHYYWYEVLCRLYEQNVSPEMGPASNIFVGYVCEWMHLPFTMPIEVTSTIYQLNLGKPTHQSWIATLRGQQQQGWGKLYKGIGAYTGLNFKPAIQDAAFDQIKLMYLRAQQVSQLTDIQNFLLGVLARVIATVIVFPAQKAKVLAIAAGGKDDALESEGGSRRQSCAPAPEGTLECIAYTYNNGGFRALYAGLGPELYRGMMSAGLMYFMKERIKRVIVALMFFLAGKKR